MILEIATHAREMNDVLNSLFVKHGLITDAGQLQDLRSMNSSCGHDGFLINANSSMLATRGSRELETSVSAIQHGIPSPMDAYLYGRHLRIITGILGD